MSIIIICVITVVVDCGRPLVNVNVNAEYNSTSFNERLTLTCREGLLPSGEPIAQCLSNGKWSPDPIDFTCKNTPGQEQGIV